MYSTISDLYLWQILILKLNQKVLYVDLKFVLYKEKRQTFKKLKYKPRKTKFR